MFTGFTPETIDFLWGIRMNNNRDWFLANKKQYTDTLYSPMKALGADLFQPFLDRPGNVLKVSRIYRDARLHHPEPYKESLWICIRRDVEWWAENPCLFFEIRPEGVAYGFCLWRPRVSTMEDFKRCLAAKPDEFLGILQKAEADTGMAVTAETYKRHKPCPDPKLQEIFDWKADISCIRHEDVSEDIFGPELGSRAGEFLAKLIPLYEYFNQFSV